MDYIDEKQRYNTFLSIEKLNNEKQQNNEYQKRRIRNKQYRL